MPNEQDGADSTEQTSLWDLVANLTIDHPDGQDAFIYALNKLGEERGHVIGSHATVFDGIASLNEAEAAVEAGDREAAKLCISLFMQRAGRFGVFIYKTMIGSPTDEHPSMD